MDTQVKINSITFKAEVDQDEPTATIILMVEGEEVGNLSISRTAMPNIWAIDGVKIETPYRGMGFYAQLLTNAINMIDGVDALYSAERNDVSNPVYQHWMGVELEEDQAIIIKLSGEGLSFKLA